MFLNSCGKRSGRIAASATRDGTRIRSQELGSCTIQCLPFRWVARRIPARGWVLAEQTRIWIPLGGTAIPRHRLGSRGRLLLAFCRAVTARRKPAHSLFRLYSVEKSNTSPSLKDASCARPEKTWMTQVPPIAQSCTNRLMSGSQKSASPQTTCNLAPSLCKPPASGWASRQGNTYGATRRTRDHTKLASAASIAAQAPPRLPP